jgi:excisionase family DNA binding protein
MNNPFETLELKLSTIESLLLELKHRQNSVGNNTDQDFITIQEAAAFLSISVQTIYGLVSRSEIPVNKRGKRLYFSKQELAGWIKKRSKENTF